MSESVSGVVIGIPAHELMISDVLHDIDNQSEPLDELIVVLSGAFSQVFITSLKVRLEASTIPSKLIWFPKKRSAGSNRNSGLELATSDYVMFFDADDRYSQERVRVARQLIRGEGFDLLLHHSTVKAVREFHEDQRTVPTSEGLFRNEELFASTFPNASRDRLKELGGGPSIIRYPKSANDETVLHHGHAVVRKEALRHGMMFHERFWPRNEDSILARDMLWAGLKVVVTERELSSYIIDASSAQGSVGLWDRIYRLSFLTNILLRRIHDTLFVQKGGAK